MGQNSLIYYRFYTLLLLQKNLKSQLQANSVEDNLNFLQFPFQIPPENCLGSCFSCSRFPYLTKNWLKLLATPLNFCQLDLYKRQCYQRFLYPKAKNCSVRTSQMTSSAHSWSQVCPDFFYYLSIFYLISSFNLAVSILIH